jgi:hypothetical protein
MDRSGSSNAGTVDDLVQGQITQDVADWLDIGWIQLDIAGHI